ncbi:hypothetical protein [Bacillus sp. Marseille-P3800]|uniref:hypothetical protein n=1 Tax=Bacillus sp. Marseille-P3800 TaxID=2014782 RepID=UPI000C07721B|nr:hypothetical protein [Bacillus sp. Marseille-P3800]
MALYAETIVEEWFNRNGYFTIRGLKDKISECDILAIKYTANGIDAIHCEVQVSVRPVNYIYKLTSRAMEELEAKSRTSAKLRPDHIIKECADAYVENKFKSRKKEEIRNKLTPGIDWTYMLVHGNVKDQKELDFIGSNGVLIKPVSTIMNELIKGRTELSITGSSAGDMIEMMNFLDFEVAANGI